jgi:hypothetical protein
MNSKTEKINEIKRILEELESEIGTEQDEIFINNFDALEIPSIISAIVDYLQPNLLPYESAIYWNLFRNSVLKSGQQYIRVSVRGLSKNVIISSSGQSASLSYNTIQNVLLGLETKNVILKAGDTNREGTLYKVFLPDEIPICQELLKQSKDNSIKEIVEKKELDYYNIIENRLKVFERDSYQCKYCSKQLTRFSATLDHLQPVSKGGDNSYDNLITSCLHCNSRRGNKPVMESLINSNSMD